MERFVAETDILLAARSQDVTLDQLIAQIAQSEVTSVAHCIEDGDEFRVGETTPARVLDLPSDPLQRLFGAPAWRTLRVEVQEVG